MLVSNGPLALGLAARTLQRPLQNLRRTRDLLLPRLLSGQVELASASANGAPSNQPGATPQVSGRKPRKG